MHKFLQSQDTGQGWKRFWLFMAVCLCSLSFLAGCAVKKKHEPTEEEIQLRLLQEQQQKRAARIDQLLDTANSAIGTPYVRGGTTTKGFDCSGFVRWAYQDIGVQLPRTAREQSVVGEAISGNEELQKGDIVAFRHPRRGYHTGIYVGDRKFIHSPRRRSSVRIASLDDPYFSKTFLGARRISLDGNEDLMAQSKERLKLQAEERNVKKKRNSTKKRQLVAKKQGPKGKNIRKKSSGKQAKSLSQTTLPAVQKNRKNISKNNS